MYAYPVVAAPFQTMRRPLDTRTRFQTVALRVHRFTYRYLCVCGMGPAAAVRCEFLDGVVNFRPLSMVLLYYLLSALSNVHRQTVLHVRGIAALRQPTIRVIS